MNTKSMYHRWITELWSGQRIAAELVSDDFVGHWPDREVRGPAELQDVVDETRNMFSDIQFRIEVGPLVDGDYVAARWVGRGRGDSGEVTFTGNDILRIADGRFVEYWTGTSGG